jgi:hypothetical protein
MADGTIHFNGKPVSQLNVGMLMRRGMYHNLSKIIELHEDKLRVHELINNEIDSFLLSVYVDILTDIEFQLQEAWNFPRDENYHRFWYTPECLCPKLPFTWILNDCIRF